MSKKIPITILTGFLGSGKTTLLNHIIRNAHGRKIAVVENEFGSVGIDADILEKTTEEIIEISDGCICCTVRKDFIEAIERLLASGRPIDHIIIECSGMSEPLPIAQSFLMNDMDGRVRLDSIICLVDAENIRSHFVTHIKTAIEQIEFADFVIITKSEWLSLEVPKDIETAIRKVNAQAPVVSTPLLDIPLDVLLDTERLEESDITRLKDTTDDHTHSESLTNYAYSSDILFDHVLLSEFFRELPYEVYRVKGFVRFAQDPSKVFLIQKVGARFTIEEVENPSDRSKNTLVFIGSEIQPFLINIELAKCSSL